MWSGLGSCDTEAVNRDVEGRIRSAWTGLHRRTGAPPSPTRWAWAADITLAMAMMFSTLNSGYHHAVPNPDQHGPLYSVNHLIVVRTATSFLVVMTALPLMVRRRFPLAAFWSCELAVMALHANVTDANDTAIFTFMSIR